LLSQVRDAVLLRQNDPVKRHREIDDAKSSASTRSSARSAYKPTLARTLSRLGVASLSSSTKILGAPPTPAGRRFQPLIEGSSTPGGRRYTPPGEGEFDGSMSPKLSGAMAPKPGSMSPKLAGVQSWSANAPRRRPPEGAVPFGGFVGVAASGVSRRPPLLRRNSGPVLHLQRPAVAPEPQAEAVGPFGLASGVAARRVPTEQAERSGAVSQSARLPRRMPARAPQAEVPQPSAALTLSNLAMLTDEGAEAPANYLAAPSISSLASTDDGGDGAHQASFGAVTLPFSLKKGNGACSSYGGVTNPQFGTGVPPPAQMPAFEVGLQPAWLRAQQISTPPPVWAAAPTASPGCFPGLGGLAGESGAASGTAPGRFPGLGGLGGAVSPTTTTAATGQNAPPTTLRPSAAPMYAGAPLTPAFSTALQPAFANPQQAQVTLGSMQGIIQGAAAAMTPMFSAAVLSPPPPPRAGPQFSTPAPQPPLAQASAPPRRTSFSNVLGGGAPPPLPGSSPPAVPSFAHGAAVHSTTSILPLAPQRPAMLMHGAFASNSTAPGTPTMSPLLNMRPPFASASAPSFGSTPASWMNAPSPTMCRSGGAGTLSLPALAGACSFTPRFGCPPGGSTASAGSWPQQQNSASLMGAVPPSPAVQRNGGNFTMPGPSCGPSCAPSPGLRSWSANPTPMPGGANGLLSGAVSPNPGGSTSSPAGPRPNPQPSGLGSAMPCGTPCSDSSVQRPPPLGFQPTPGAAPFSNSNVSIPEGGGAAAPQPPVLDASPPRRPENGNIVSDSDDEAYAQGGGADGEEGGMPMYGKMRWTAAQ